MKIYSAYEPGLKTTLYDIRRYIGKEVWVWCNTRHGIGYCRFLAETTNQYNVDIIVYNFIRSTDKTELLAYSGSFLERNIHHIWNVDSADVGNPNRLQFRLPLVTLTTEELLHICGSDALSASQNYNPNQFTPYEGKDVWILCECSSYDDCYVKVLSQTENTVTYYNLPEYMVPDGYPGEDIDPYDRQEVEFVLAGRADPMCSHKAGIKIIKPVESYTTEEIQELLDNCKDYIYEDEDNNYDEEND